MTLDRVLMRAGRLGAVLLAAALALAGCNGAATPAGTQAGNAATLPRVINVGSGSSGTGPPQTGATMGIVQQQQLLDEEFRKDGIAAHWSFFKGLGPAQNEAFANGTLDFGYQGDLSAIIGRASGLKVKVLAATCVRQNNYVGVKAGSNIRSIQDLKGRHIAVQIGGPTYLFLSRLLQSEHLTLADVTVHNVTGASAIAALLAGQVDAVLGTNLLDLAHDNSIKVIFSTRDSPDLWTNIGVLVAAEDFIQRYPQATQRVVDQWVKAAAWGAQEGNRDALFRIWAQGGTPVDNWEHEYAGRTGVWITTPLLDPFVLDHLQKDIDLSRQLGLIRSSVNVQDWVDARFLQQSLKRLGLQGVWTPYAADGKESAI